MISTIPPKPLCGWFFDCNFDIQQVQFKLGIKLQSREKEFAIVLQFNHKKKVIAKAKEVLERSQLEKGSYVTTILGKDFIVLPNVFSPKYFSNTDTLFVENLPINKGEEVLEIGSGTGVVAVLLAYRGVKHVIANDINPSAVENTRQNIIKHHLEKVIEVREGDVYSPLKNDEKFDVIIWNLPFGFTEENKDISDLHKALFDPGYKATERFIIEADKYLKPNGRLYMGFSSSMGSLSLIKIFCKKVGRKIKIIFVKEAGGVKFEILEAIK